MTHRRCLMIVTSSNLSHSNRTLRKSGSKPSPKATASLPTPIGPPTISQAMSQRRAEDTALRRWRALSLACGEYARCRAGRCVNRSRGSVPSVNKSGGLNVLLGEAVDRLDSNIEAAAIFANRPSDDFDSARMSEFPGSDLPINRLQPSTFIKGVCDDARQHDPSHFSPQQLFTGSTVPLATFSITYHSVS